MARSIHNSAPVHNIVSQGQFNGDHYEITRDGSHAFLSLKLEENVKMILYTNLNNIVAKSAGITVEYHPTFSLKNFLLSLELIPSVVSGPGELLLSSPIW